MPSTTYRAVAIINAASGADDKERMPDQVREIFQDHGIPCEVEKVTAGANIAAMAHDAAARGAEVVMAGGGDGTLRAVAEGLAGTETVMAVLPVGTLNHFARDLEMPLDFEQAVEVAATGTPVNVDVGQANGRVFINNAVIGLYPAYRSERDRREARGWGGRAAMLAGMLATVWRYPILTVRFEVNAAAVVRRTPYILIGNNEHAMEGSKPWERGSMTEGRLWVYILRDQSRLAFVRILLNVLLGRFHGPDEFDVIHTGAVSVQARRKRLAVSLDGEIVKLDSPVQFRSWPRALRAMVPAGSKRVSEFVCELEGGVPSAS